ncbi:DUF4748 domain-containing protein [Candidatus Pacearchaeota archaeon]|jgi:hypothetical protein|nr:DUF4748 domain-containing protein [Candidatus Pacearchaeota archaeon]
MWIDKAFWYGLSFLLVAGIISFIFKNKKQKNKILFFVTIAYFIIGLFLAGAYIYTHTPISNIVPPIIYIRVVDAGGNPVKDASCFADIITEKTSIENRLLKSVPFFSQLECYGLEKCQIENYWGYYKLEVTNYSYKSFLWIFQKPEGIIKGDFEINIVCRTNNSVAHYEMNKTNFPCSPLPLLGNYITPSFYCSDKNKLINEHAYNLDENFFDEYDRKAINFINDNYKDEIILANNKLSAIIYSQKINDIVGIIPDKESYGNPYVFNEFMAMSCRKRLELAQTYKISLVLSRFELPPNFVGTQKYNQTNCSFMKEVYSDRDYIYEIVI